ncbi:unnamed protein product, partial [Trichogramma brassicae]
MAAKSGGVVDWNAIIKPILSVSHGSFNKTDIIELVKAIVQSEPELFSHDDEYEAFYSCFAALVADYLGSCANTFNKSQIPLVWQACQILLTYLMSKLTQQNSQSNDNISPLILTTKQILLPIRALCIGQSLLAKSEEVALVAIMKNSKLPQNVKSSLEKGNGEKDSSVQSGKEAKKVRNDLSTCILEQLTMPLQDFGTINDSTYDNANKATFEAQSNEQGNEIKMMFIANNISILQSMGAGDTLLCMCSNLPNLSRYAKKYQTYLNKKVFCLPANQSDAHIIRHSLHSVVNDINILHNVVSLPILEPLTSAKLEKLSLLTMSCLYYSVANATASSIVSVTNATSPKCSSNTNVNQQNNQNSKSIEEEYDTLAINVVERSLEIFNLVSNVIKHSTRAGGHACNFILGTADKLKYPLLIDALIDILNILNQLSIPRKRAPDGRNKLNATFMCGIQYTFSISWRLLLILPPSTPYMDKLALGEEIPAGPLLLHSLIWGPRAAYKTFTGWMKDCLVKQGMYTQYAENLLKTVSTTVNNLKYNVTLAKNCITTLKPPINSKDAIVPLATMPKLISVTILSAVIGQLHVLMDETIWKSGNGSDIIESPNNTTTCPEDSEIRTKVVDLLISLTMDARFEYLSEMAQKPLNILVGDRDQEARQLRDHLNILTRTYNVIIGYTNNADEPLMIQFDIMILKHCIKYWEKLLEKPVGCKALHEFFTSDSNRTLASILLSVASPHASPEFSKHVLHFFNKLFTTVIFYSRSAPETSSPAASEETQKTEVPNDVVNNDQASNQWQALLTTSETTAPNNLPSTSTSSSEEQQTMQQNNQLLRSLTNYIVKENDNSADGKSVVMLQALIPIAYRKLSSAAEGVSFTDLMQVMFTLADSGSDKGHTILFQAAIEWIDICKKKLLGEDPENLDSKSSSYIEAGCCVLNYVADIVNAVCPQNQFNERERALSPPWEGAQPANDVTDSDWIDEIAHDEEESGAEDSDEDSLCNKLCTFTITQKEFMNQHWYHCHTCNMVDGVGVCSICAKVCHRGHDVTYAKYGNFFCDCGAKEDASCQALVKRSPQNSEQPQNTSTYNTSSSSENMMLPSSLRRRAASPVHYSEKYDKSGKDKQKQLALAKQLGSKDWVLSKLWDSGLVSSLVELIRTLIPAVVASCNKFSPVGCHARAQAALSQLHYLKKKFEHTDQLMVHVRQYDNFLSAHMIRRVAMCCLSSPHGKRQHLAVSHEKGKITVLQLSALLKQADSSKRKLTLTRLASAPIPFTVLSMTGNQWNEDFLAVCGLKDCHVLTFNSSGTVSDHLVLHPQLETGNFIIKAIWLPGSQTQLALVTADFVKIYDLSKDALSPQYYFLVPTGKIRDCTFIYTESGEFHLLLMSSAGYIYNQVMDEDSQAKHGPFYVTHTLDVFHPDIKDNGQVCGGGVSIYYSHALQLLFFSYVNGKSFVAPLKYVDDIDLVNLIQISSNKLNGGNSSGGGNKSNNNQPQPLCQWSEVPNHPGLICSVLQISNNPVILMIKPETISIQEIKVVPAKAKIMDMVAIRHPSSNAEHRTTLILLCEDGSLRIYMAAMGQTGYWMSSSVSVVMICYKVYNVTQIKNRLNTTGMYVVSTKSMGFNIEVTNNDTSSVITGIRVQLGSQDIQRAPMYVEVFGRSVRTILTRSRWFDIPLTREESLQADKKLTITFGPSQDPEGVIMVDSIKIYGKTKDAFGWPEESEDIPPAQGAPTQATTGVSSVTDNTENLTVSPTPLPAVDKMVSSVLDVLEYSFTLSNDDSKSELKQSAIEVASKLLTLPTPPPVQMHTTALLSALHVSKPQYHAHKDQVLLSHVMDVLKLMRETEDPNDIDAENFYRLVLIVRSIAVTRPHNLHKFAEQNYRPYDASISKSHLIEKMVKSNDLITFKLAVPVYEHERLAYQIQYQNNFETPHLMLQLMEVMWLLHCAYPKNLALAPVVVPGLTHTDAVVHAIIEIIHAFTICDMNGFAPIAAKLYLQMLLCCDTAISFNAKQAIIKVLRPRYKRRRVHIPSPPHFNISSDVDKSPVSQPQPQQPPPPPPPAVASVENEADENFDVDNVVSMVLLGAEAAAAAAGNQGDGGAAANNFLQLLDMPQAEDDEAMVELAIALSLQEHEDGPGANVGAPLPALIPGLEGLQNFGGQALQSLQALAAQVQVQQAAQVQEAGHYSDTTASAAGSDDEGSTAATDGSTLRTSPAEQGGSGGSKGSESGSSESGGSAVDSIMGEHNVSGRSSAYGDAQNDGVLSTSGPSNQQSRSETGLVNIPSVSSVQDGSNEQGAGNEPENDFVGEVTANLHDVRLVILDKLTEFLPNLVSVPGVQVIPFMQVLLMLTSDLDGQDERDQTCFEKLLNYFVKELNLENPVVTDVCQRSSKRETHLVIMRLLSVLMSRSKYNPKSQAETSNFISQTTASVLNKSGVINYCLCLLKALIEYWKTVNTDDTGTVIGGQLLKEHLSTSPPDMSPFFLRLYVKGHANDVFEPYPQLLTEMALRLPYQVHKHAESNSASPAFDQKSWYYYLCEYMMTYQTPFVRRQVRKLLLFICGNKEKYRQLRDLHALVSHVKAVQQCCSNGGYDPTEPMPLTINLPYDSLVELIEHLKCCVEIATSRTGNWQRFCIKHSTVLSYLFTISTLLDEGVSPTVLQLLQCAICSSSKSKDVKSKEIKSALNNKERRDREKSEDSDTDAKFEETQSVNLVEQIQKQVSPQLLVKFIQTFLLETNNTNIRWQAHSLILAIYKNSNPIDQESILDYLWKLWPQLPIYGRKAAQFVDIIGYFSLRTPQNGNKMNSYMEQAVAVLCAQNQLLSRHPNANLYSNLAQFVELDGYYLESEPCLVCNNPEVPMITIKLSSIKVDSKFTTTTQIIKLVGSHTISRITLRIGDLKRTKMVRSINVYYNNRTVQAVVELKNKPAMWHKAKKIGLIQGQTEVKMEFPLPIVACNLMIEYSDFYENIQASSETLQCPRCSASVPANPGVCANCGENVYQCHKCRAINYDEKDPFLCHACGFCKYAKFDYTLTGRPCCAVDPIESDEDRKKTVVTINTLLDKADRVYKTLISNKPNLEMLLVKISDHRLDRFLDEATAPQSGNSGTSTQVNRAIQLLAQRYCGECKTSFEELSKIIQRVLACRRELVAYDRNQRGQSQGQPRSMSLTGSEQTLSVEQKSGSTPVVGRCYGCASSATEYCLTLLRALATNTAAREVLCKQGLIQELIEHNLRRGTVLIQEEVRQLLCLVTRDNAQSTKELCSLLTNRVTMTLRGRVVTSDLSTAVRHEMALLGALIQKEDSCWEQKLRCVMQLFLMACKDSKSPVVMESIILPCLKILQCLLKPEQPISKKNKDKTIDSLATVQPPEGVSIDLAKWLNGELNILTATPASRVKSYAIWVENLCQGTERKKEVLLLLTSYLDELCIAGESSAEYLTLFQNLIRQGPWKQFLAVRGVLNTLADLLSREIAELHRLEETTLTSDLAQGYSLKMLTELLATFLDQENIKQHYKGRLVGAVLNGYLSLRRLVVQRTRLIDDTQEKLLELLEEMTTGTEEETKAFMAVCVETAKKYSPLDTRTPVFIFERLCSIIYPEENDVGEFFLTLEKDPQQEDFLQGRMLGNPYSSLEPGLGPLMRDVKNKICQDCELVALLEDDNGMELLVNNKIISLDLPVKEVYKKVWVMEGGECDAMRVVYRMRGLLGDATEEFVETLNASSEQEVNNEEVYKMANVLADCGGLQVMIERLAAIQDVNRAKPLLQV